MGFTHNAGTNRRMRANRDAVTALSAKIGFPNRQLFSKIALF
ncbi:Uncharacterised protein [Vibrio cholerae]|nr:Uncharacterised protein [Vibrio cholerae]CSI34122.1 Uncharacterised protein [Vibrio cholerae]